MEKSDRLYDVLKPALLKRFGGNEQEARAAFLNKDLRFLHLQGLELNEFDLSGADFSYCNFSDSKITWCNFSDSKLNDANFENADISRCEFSDAGIYNSHFYGAQITHCSFFQAGFSNTSFHDSHIFESEFIGASLRKVSYIKAHLFSCNFYEADLAGADFGYSVLWRCGFLNSNPREANFKEWRLRNFDYKYKEHFPFPAQDSDKAEMADRLVDLGVEQDMIERAQYNPGLPVHIDSLGDRPSDFDLTFNGITFQVENPHTGKRMGEAISTIEEHNRRSPKKGLKLPDSSKMKNDSNNEKRREGFNLFFNGETYQTRRR